MIQSSRKADAFVFTPDDSEYEWKLAKRLFEGINSLEAALLDNQLLTNQISEIFATAAYRKFSYNHPIYKLIYPHIKSVISLNAYARQPEGKNGENGFFTKASHLTYQNQFELFDIVLEDWDPDFMNLEYWIEKNGLTEDILPYPYALRDDGIKEKG